MMKFIRHFSDLGINGVAARWYDGNSRKHRIAEMKGYAEEVARHLHDGSTVLEIAPGPGYLAIELAKLGNFRITGTDISSDFVRIAKRNAERAGVGIDFRQGNVSDMPFPDRTFDFIICTAAFKNFRDPGRALTEMHRVLKPEGEGLIIDLKRNVSNEDLDRLADDMKVKGIEALFMKLTFKHFLRRGAYTKDEMERLVSRTAFSKADIKESAATLATSLRKMRVGSPERPVRKKGSWDRVQY